MNGNAARAGPDKSPSDASILGSAEPVIAFTLKGGPNSWLRKHVPEGVEINIGPVLFTASAMTIVLTLLTALTLLARELAPEEYRAAKEQLQLAYADAVAWSAKEDSEEDKPGLGALLLGPLSAWLSGTQGG